MAARLAVAPWAELFDKVAPQAGDPAQRLAGALEKRIPHHLRERGRPRRPVWGEGHLDGFGTAERVAPLVRALEAGKIRPGGLVWAIDGVLEDPDRPAEEILDEFRIRPEDEDALATAVEEVAQKARGMEGRAPEILFRWAMGEVMRSFFGRLDPALVREKLKKALGTGEGEVAG